VVWNCYQTTAEANAAYRQWQESGKVLLAGGVFRNQHAARDDISSFPPVLQQAYNECLFGRSTSNISRTPEDEITSEYLHHLDFRPNVYIERDNKGRYWYCETITDINDNPPVQQQHVRGHNYQVVLVGNDVGILGNR
jgi:hypothetical protein